MDNQDEIVIHILQGDSVKADECTSIVKFKISGISPGKKRKEPEIKLTLEIDTMGEIRRRARELPDRDLVIEGKPNQILTEQESTFSGYGGLWGDR